MTTATERFLRYTDTALYGLRCYTCGTVLIPMDWEGGAAFIREVFLRPSEVAGANLAVCKDCA